MIGYLKLLFAEGVKSYLESQTFQFIFWPCISHSHVNLFSKHKTSITKTSIINKQLKRKVMTKLPLWTLELICFPSKLSSINSRLKSGLFTLQLMGSLWVVQGRWIWEDSLRWGSQLNATTLKKKRDYWWWTCLWVFYQIAIWF